MLGDTRPVLPLPVRESLTQASLSASRIAGQPQSGVAVGVAMEMMKAGLPEYLQLAVLNKRSIILRSEGRYNESDDLIQNALDRKIDPDVRFHCQRGRLLLSQAENAILRKEFGNAIDYLEQWEISPHKQSHCEWQVVRLKNTVYGRIHRYQGHFADAHEYLIVCLRIVTTDSSHHHHLHHLADVYCEMRRPDKVENLLRDHIGGFLQHRKFKSESLRRLLLPWAEASIQKHDFENAQLVLLHLDELYSGLAFRNISEQLGHVRSIFGLLRIRVYKSLWSEALRMSDKLSDLMEKYTSFSDGNYYKGLNFLFRSVIHLERGELSDSRDMFSMAKSHDQGPRHFITGLGTYVLQELRCRTESFQAVAYEVSTR